MGNDVFFDLRFNTDCLFSNKSETVHLIYLIFDVVFAIKSTEFRCKESEIVFAQLQNKILVEANMLIHLHPQCNKGLAK